MATALLAGFGSSEVLSHEHRVTGMVGRSSNQPPEMFQGLEHGSAVDIWQMACLLFEMVTGHRPFEGASGKFSKSNL